MIYKIALVLLSVSTIASANTSSILGTWLLGVSDLGNNVKIAQHLNIEKNQVTMIAVCKWDQKIIRATATVQAVISETSIETLQSVRKVVWDGDQGCEVNVNKEKFDYTLLDNGQTLINKSGNFSNARRLN